MERTVIIWAFYILYGMIGRSVSVGNRTDVLTKMGYRLTVWGIHGKF
jgi:hypothetical protein